MKLTRVPMPQQTLLRHTLFAALGGIVVYFVSVNTSTFEQIRLSTVGFTLIAVAGLTVLVGLNGQISLGHGALMAVGAYTVAELQVHQPSLPLAVDLLVAVLFSAIAGLVVGVAAARLRGPYLGGATLALAVGIPDLAREYFNGDQGVSVPLTQSPSFDPGLAPERWQAWICWLSALITLVLLANLARSRIGREWRAARDDEVAAALSGIRVARVQVLAFIVSAAAAGLAGGLLVIVVGTAGPGSFLLTLSVSLLAAAVVGGLGSLTGALWGAIIIVYLQTWSDDFSRSLSLGANARNNLPIALYGALLIVVLLAAPSGIQGAIRRVAALARRALPSSAPPSLGQDGNNHRPPAVSAAGSTSPSGATPQRTEP